MRQGRVGIVYTIFKTVSGIKYHVSYFLLARSSYVILREFLLWSKFKDSQYWSRMCSAWIYLYNWYGQMSPGQMLPWQMSPRHTAYGKDGTWKLPLPLMFGQNWFSNSCDIANMDTCFLGKCCLDKCHCIWWHLFKMVPEVSKSL